MSEKDVVFIVGTGRSGTSALTGTLSLCGAALPKLLYGANEHNPKGFWEPVDVLALNDTFLLGHGSVAGDPRMRGWSDNVVTQSDRVAFVTKIRAFLSAYQGESTLVLKDPRITDLLEFWIEAACREGLSPKVVIAIRHPNEVLASMGARESTQQAFYVSYNLLAERNSRSVPRVVVDFPLLLLNWRSEVARISETLSLTLKPCNEAIVDKFLTPDLRRQRCSDSNSIPEGGGYSWMLQVYDILSKAARGERIDVAALNEIYHGYRKSYLYQEGDGAITLTLDGAREEILQKIAEGTLQEELQRHYPPVSTLEGIAQTALADPHP